MIADEQDHQDALWVCMHCAERLGATRNIDVTEKIRRIAREVLKHELPIAVAEQVSAISDDFCWMFPGGNC